MRRETSEPGRMMSMPRGCGAGPEFLHQNNDALVVIARADAHALDVQVNLAPAAIHGVDLRVHALIGVTHQGGDRLFELLDGQADVESEEVLAVDFVGTKPPQVRGDVVPQLDLQLAVEDDDGKWNTAQNPSEEDIAAG